jgi:hypothetical protein
MAIVASDNGGGDFKIVPAGNHIAVCSMVVDLGKQRVDYQGESSVKRQAYVAWELPNETVEWTDRDGNERKGPMRIGRTFTVSLHRNATMRGVLESWRGRNFTEEEARGFDITKLAGAPCMVNVTHTERNGKTYANVAAVTPMPKGMDRPSLSDAALIYDDEHLETFEHLPEWLQKKVTDQVVEQKQPAYAGDDLGSDEIPF